MDSPVGKGVPAYNDCLVEFILAGTDFKVSIWEETCNKINVRKMVVNN
jgi:hypothetical protein